MTSARLVFLCAAIVCVCAAEKHGLAQKAPLRPFESLRVAPSNVEGRQSQGRPLRQAQGRTVAKPATPRTTQTPRTTTPPKPAASHAVAQPDHNAVIKRYCVSCHSDARKLNALSLVSFDVAHAAQNAEVAEKMIVKLQAGLMPPPLARASGRRDAERAGRPRSKRRSMRRPPRSRIPARARSSGSIAPSTRARSAICSRSTSTPATGCRSTRRARTSTTSPTRRRCRRRCSSRT